MKGKLIINLSKGIFKPKYRRYRIERIKYRGNNFKVKKREKIDPRGISSYDWNFSRTVSKWENGNSMPDISILAPLARALNTSIDTLLSFHKELSEEEVNNIKSKLTKLFLHEGYAIGEKECKKYLSEYPNSIHFGEVYA
ncbi:helix-turn-helix domain-containing protein [Candidatus Clostridium helianthi]|uniref:helix-turn-helix domain-containing protein n=1 Tax=Candidatus Clostridium helianthi TaxID=3381660 RepID=UPI003C12C1E8